MQINSQDLDLLEMVEREESYVKNFKCEDGKSGSRELRSVTSSQKLHARFRRDMKATGEGGLAILHRLSKCQLIKGNVEGIGKSEQNQMYYFLVFKILEFKLVLRNQSYLNLNRLRPKRV